MFFSDNQMRERFYSQINELAGSLQNAPNKTWYIQKAFQMAGATGCYTKSVTTSPADALKIPVFSKTEPEIFMPNNAKINTVYHIMCRAYLFDEVISCASYLPAMPKEFLTQLRQYAEIRPGEGDHRQVLNTEYIEKRMHDMVGLDPKPEDYRDLINQAYIQRIVPKLLRVCDSIMMNAINHMVATDQYVEAMATYTLVACCEYLERIGIYPSTMEGIACRGDVWFDLRKSRRRDVSAKITWWDHYTQDFVTNTFPYHIGNDERRDRNS